MNQVIIGLSGHIDHGKTSLIKSLTGSHPMNIVNPEITTSILKNTNPQNTQDV